MELLELVNFWFENRKKWFNPSEDFDNLCRIKYNDLLENYEYINYDSKKSLEVLGLIILLDQIPRNIFRGKPSAYKYDNISSIICLNNLILSNELDGWYKIFFLMPLKHSEDIRYQEDGIRICNEIISIELNINLKKLYKRNLVESLKHYNIVKKYGRFPKRNKILKRESSIDEKKYILENQKGFI